MRINSMTGYGKGISIKEGLKLTIELKTVNHRFLDLTLKLPKQFIFAEDIIRKTIKDNFARGHFDLYLSFEDTRLNKTKILFDNDLISAYVDAAKEISDDFFVENNLGVKDILAIPDVVKTSTQDDDEEVLKEMIIEALNEAAQNLKEMRAKEGAIMIADFKTKLATIAQIVEKIEQKAPFMVEEHFAKVRERVQEMLKDVSIDEAKMLNEIAFYSDKVCVDEEIQRLKTHMTHFESLLNQGGVVGKQLDFIVQEMNREANTCGSKCNNIEVSTNVIALKNEIEKVREQIQNIE